MPQISEPNNCLDSIYCCWKFICCNYIALWPWRHVYIGSPCSVGQKFSALQVDCSVCSLVEKVVPLSAAQSHNSCKQAGLLMHRWTACWFAFAFGFITFVEEKHMAMLLSKEVALFLGYMQWSCQQRFICRIESGSLCERLSAFSHSA